ncbi:MAG TPA: TolC family protein [Puia sp.]|jgi:outer membrane protein TolC|nr:TolC family protein [Puia sp.]
MCNRILIIGFIFLTGKNSFAQKNTLDFYIQAAVQNSPLLKDYQSQMESNAIDSERIRAQYKPQVTGSSINSYAPVINGFGYDNAITNGGQLSGIVNVSQTLVSHGNLTAQYKNIQLQNQGIANTARISTQDLKRTITNQYLTAFGTLQELNLAKEIHELLQKEVGILKTLTEKNVYRQTDYLTLLVTVQQQDLSLRQLDIQYHNDFATLNYLAGIVDTAAVNLDEPSFTINQLPGPDHSVFFQKYTIDSLILVHNRTLLDYSYKPKVNLYANGGYLSSLMYQGYKNFGTSVGLDITVPIYDGKQKKMQYRKLDISERARSGYKNFYTNQYYQQINLLEQQLQQTESLIGDINNQIKYSNGLIEVNTKLLETGDAKIADLIIALNNYLNAKNLLTQNKVSRLQIINQINYWNR